MSCRSMKKLMSSAAHVGQSLGVGIVKWASPLGIVRASDGT